MTSVSSQRQGQAAFHWSKHLQAAVWLQVQIEQCNSALPAHWTNDFLCCAIIQMAVCTNTLSTSLPFMQSLRSKLARTATFVIWRQLDWQKLRICHQLAALIGDNDAVMVENELHRPNTIEHRLLWDSSDHMCAALSSLWCGQATHGQLVMSCKHAHCRQRRMQ